MRGGDAAVGGSVGMARRRAMMVTTRGRRLSTGRGAPLLLAIIAVVAAAVAIPTPVAALRYTGTLTSSDVLDSRFRLLNPDSVFGFSSDGSLSMTVTCPSRADFLVNVELRLLSNRDYKDFSGNGYDCSTAAGFIGFNLTTTPGQPGVYNIQQQFGGPGQSSFYYFVMDFCGLSYTDLSSLSTCEIEMNAFSSPDQHLSRDQIQIPTIYTVLCGIWGVAVLLWIGNWVRFYKYDNLLHVSVFALLLFKSVTLALALHLYMFYSDHGYFHHAGDVVRIVCGHMETSIFFWLMLLVAHGWRIIFQAFERKTHIFLAVYPALLALCNDGRDLLHQYFAGFAIILVLAMAYIIFRASGNALLRLKQKDYELHDLFRTEVEERLGLTYREFAMPLWKKFKIIESLRTFLLLYAMLWAIIEISTPFMIGLSYVAISAQETLECAAYLYLAYKLRLVDMRQFVSVEEPDLDELEVTVVQFQKRDQPYALLVPVESDVLLKFMAQEEKKVEEREQREEELRLKREREAEEKKDEAGEEQAQRQEGQEGEEGEEGLGDGYHGNGVGEALMRLEQGRDDEQQRDVNAVRSTTPSHGQTAPLTDIVVVDVGHSNHDNSDGDGDDGEGHRHELALRSPTTTTATTTTTTTTASSTTTTATSAARTVEGTRARDGVPRVHLMDMAMLSPDTTGGEWPDHDDESGSDAVHQPQHQSDEQALNTVSGYADYPPPPYPANKSLLL